MIADVSTNVHDIPCFATIRNEAENQSPSANSYTPGVLYLEHIHQLEKYEARKDIQVLILKKNGTFLPSNPLRRITSNKVILMLAEEDWFMVVNVTNYLSFMKYLILSYFALFLVAKKWYVYSLEERWY